MGEGAKSRRVGRLIKRMADDGRLPILLDHCAQRRPGLDWETIRQQAGEQPDLFQFGDSP
ncbi:MAG: hypothetical protein M5U34_40440 [Chloroflexi bacterium]|nr:hypothetical protein [Chloroflexota bacterium]